MNSALFSAFLGGGLGGLQPHFLLSVRRDHLVEDALRGIIAAGRAGPSLLKRPLKVSFVGEAGVDAGGLRKEFFGLLTAQLLNPAYGMFVEGAGGVLWFNPDSLEAAESFELVGSLVGLALYNGVLLEVSFPLALYRKLKREVRG